MSFTFAIIDWPTNVKFNEPGDVPGPVVQFEDDDQGDIKAGYGFESDNLYEGDWFFFHTDRRGSTSYLTDTAGNVSQFVCYTPYGEAIVDEHLTTYENPFKFSDKELDDITGLYDHGARNRNPISTLWYGIDPLFEKYPDFSPYNYCAGNPVKYVDPDGRDKYVFKEDGTFSHKEKMDGTHFGVLSGNENRETIIFYFADPVNDTKQIDEGSINRVEYVSEEKIQSMLRKQGAFESNILYFGWQSQGGGAYDYSFSVLPEEYPNDELNEQMQSNYLYLPEGDSWAHNHMNFGNYLWAATGYIVGFDYVGLQLGAHANSIFNSGRNGYEPQLDSKDDQLSIKKGIFHAQVHNYRKMKK